MGGARPETAGQEQRDHRDAGPSRPRTETGHRLAKGACRVGRQGEDRVLRRENDTPKLTAAAQNIQPIGWRGCPLDDQRAHEPEAASAITAQM